MTQPSSAAVGGTGAVDGTGPEGADGDVSKEGRPEGQQEGQPEGPIIRDKRRLDPATGQGRAAYAAAQPVTGGVTDAGADQAAAPGIPSAAELAELEAARAAAEELLGDLQRLQAEYVNYRRRVDRDRDVARDLAVASVLEALLPVLDDVHLARQHGDLESGPFVAIAEKLETVLSRFGMERYGEPGETFDPKVHEALIHTQAELAEGTTETTVVQVLQPGYRAGERILRAARVAVADPQ
jgi:molecular chaperone GrpE